MELKNILTAKKLKSDFHFSKNESSEFGIIKNNQSSGKSKICINYFMLMPHGDTSFARGIASTIWLIKSTINMDEPRPSEQIEINPNGWIQFLSVMNPYMKLPL